MHELCDLKIHVNGQCTFFLNERVVSKFSGRLKKMIKQEKRKSQIRKSEIEVEDFPGGPDGFELVLRFCYNNGRITITPSNVSLLHCSAIFLEMTENVSTYNLLQQTKIFLEGLFYWTWNDLLICVKSCESFFSYADSSGLLEKLICSLVAKITQNSGLSLIASSSSSSSSPETTSGFRFSSSVKTTPESIKPLSSSKLWWFDDLTILPPNIIERVIRTMDAYGIENDCLILTKFLLYYLKAAVQIKGGLGSKSDYSGLADTAVYGVVLMGKTSFSCRGLFWVLRVVSGFGLSREYRAQLEGLIGEMLDQATLDDLLVSGHGGGVYDVNLVLRLVRVFVSDDAVTIQRMKKVGKLIDKYMREISPDHNLKITKFLAIAESLPDSARDCFDGVYRAIDIYLESHPSLSFEERSRLCRCLNYEKLTLGACKDLAKNPQIPPRISIEALIAQQSKIQSNVTDIDIPSPSNTQLDLDDHGSEDDETFSEESIEMKLNLQKMQYRVVKLEKVCEEMKNQMSKMVKHGNKLMGTPTHNKAVPRLC
ncbi:BTB/POZ domain-containing protein At3g19850 [Macadamia integrifolia]|uniref:BTB/POZ domain-containing protein At3g19850 n=1 Tax=Macadamia integrifolia TaxID=60698 RepID=UPI001C4F6D14|nr:BTB/POZ domain-containing protein At3g19850 [Macadamia integrifolia]